MSEGLRELLAAQLLKDNDDTKFNVRDFTDVLFDPEDPVDIGAAGVAATGVGVPAAAGIKTLNTGRKAANLLRALLVPTKASKNPTKEVGRKVGNVVKLQVAGDVIPGVDGMAKGGLADLPVQHAFFGGLKRFYEAGKEGYKLYKKQKKKNKAEDKKDTKTDTKTDEEKPLLISPISDIKKVRDAAAALLATEGARKTLRGAQRAGLYLGAPAATYFTGKALLGEDEEETPPPPPPISAPIEEPKSFLEKLKDMDPALARALIAGGAKMLQPTEGPVRSFLGLGEFGEGFSESLAASEAGKSDTQQLYETYLRSVPEGQAPLDIIRFADTLKQTADDRRQDRSDILAYLQENQEAPKDATLSDFIIEKNKLAEIGIDYQGEKDPSISELLIRYSGPERQSIINLAVSEATYKD